MSVFGPMISGSDVEKAVADTLRTWFATYTHEFEDRLGVERGSIPVPGSFTRINDFSKLPEEAPPVLLIVSPGIVPGTIREEAGEVAATWNVVVGVIAATHGRETVRDLSQFYSVIIRTLMVQKGGLGGFANHTTWSGENYQNIGTLNERSNAAARDMFLVEVSGVVDRTGGPLVPDTEDISPHPDWPLADLVDVTVTGK